MLIAGAGVIGLATAMELGVEAATLGRALHVTVLERGTPMREASWAAAGMLAANDPENPRELTPLSQFSFSLYPEFLRRVERLSGQAVPLRTTHTLQISPHRRPSDVPLSPKEAAERVPGLHPALAGNLLWLDEASLDPRDLCRALPLAARAAGVRIVEDSRVEAVDFRDNRILVSTGKGDYRADALAICCGSWSGSVSLGRNGEEEFPLAGAIVPRKGQMLALRMPENAGAPSLSVVVRSPEIYLVPRGDGRIIVGATVEDAGFDRGIRPEATAWLLDRAAALWPPIREGRVEDVWTGIRPGTPDALPTLGPLDPQRRVWVASGHYRNGILLAPGTARLLATSLLQPDSLPPLDLALDWSAFAPSRFARERNASDTDGFPGACHDKRSSAAL